MSTGYGDLVAALQRLQNEFNKQGLATLAGRVTAAQSLLLGPSVASALHIRTAVLERRRPRIHNPVRSNAQQLAKDVRLSDANHEMDNLIIDSLFLFLFFQCVESLAQSNSQDAIELCNLLSTYEMEGLLQAHDRIATTTDRTAAPNVYGPSLSLDSSEVSTNAAISQNLINNNAIKVSNLTIPLL